VIDPHGGELIDLLARAEKREELVKEGEGLPAITLSARQAADLELLAIGGFSPLRGFQGSDDWRRVVDEMRLADGLPWSIPITLATGAQAADGDRLALRDGDGRLLGVIDVDEVFERDLEREARHVYRTTDVEHPGVAALNAEGSRCVAGQVRAVDLPEHPDAFRPYLLPPAASRAAFGERGWRRSSASRPATRSTGRTSTSPRRRSSRWTGCSSIRWSGRRSPTTSRPTCGCAAMRR